MRGISFILNDDGERWIVDFFDGTFVDIQDICGGSVEVAPSSDNVSIWVNEDGKGIGLPVNAPANMVWALYDIFCCLTEDRLVGNVVITGPVDADGEDTDLGMDDVRLIIEHLQQGQS
jgi:Domain of unknown function (DUF3846)